MPLLDVDSAETELRVALANSDQSAGVAAPILRYLIAGDASSLCSEEVVARCRGMLRDIARQLLAYCEEADIKLDASAHHDERHAALIQCLVESAPLLNHIHAQAFESQLAEKLQSQLGIDPILSSLLQTLVASHDPQLSSLGMRFLASQARHRQAQRRMTMPLAELPKEVLQSAMAALLKISERDGTCQNAEDATARIRVDYDESATRLKLAERLISMMGEGARAALTITDSGAALFLSALAATSGLKRDVVSLSADESQAARLALALCSSGLEREAIEAQFMAILPHVPFPRGFEHIGPQNAASILASADSGQGT